jgi:CheY-like chemotaxis protein
MHERIFDMFTRVDHELTRRTGGLGIGLALSRKLVELHGGRIWARSAGTGKGSEFVIRLPAARAAAAVAAAPGAGMPASAPRRVLVVDDNVDAAESLAMLLETLGHDVRLAHDGGSALALVEADPPDVILLDIGLPVVDGFTVAQRLRGDRRFAGMRIVALSGYGRDQDLARGRDAGFDEHLVKPVDVGRLRAAMQC